METKWVRLNSENADTYSEKIAELYNLTYPNNTYPLSFVYSKGTIKEKVGKYDYLYWNFLLSEDNIIGAIMYIEEHNEREMLGLAVRPEERGKGFYNAIMAPQIRQEIVDFFNRGGTKISSDIQLTAYQTLISTITAHYVPTGFFPCKRNIKASGGEKRASMYYGYLFPSEYDWKDKINDLSKCALLNIKQANEVIPESKRLFDIIYSFINKNLPNVSGIKSNKTSFKVDSSRIFEVDHLGITHSQDFSVENSLVKVCFMEPDTSAKLVIDKSADKHLYSIIKKIISEYESAEYLEVDTSNVYQQRVFYDLGFKPTALTPEKLVMSKLKSFSNEDAERIKRLNQQTLEQTLRIIEKHYSERSDYKQLISITKQYCHLSDIVAGGFLSL